MAAVWADAVEVLGTGERRASAPPRLFGGFSFRADHRPTGMWRGFPSGLFVLPAVELESRGDVSRVRVQRLVEAWADPHETDEALEAELEAVLSALSRPAAAAGTSNRPPIDLPAAPAPGARDAWRQVVNDALDAIGREYVSKVVLARTLDVAPPEELDPIAVTLALWADNPRAHVFLFEPEPGATLLGAAPETVATVSGSDFHATAVAGSVPLGSSPEETAALAEQLLASRKDQLEHRFAVEDMVERLEEIAADVRAEWEPHVITLSRIQHLETRIRARLPEEGTVLSALQALHPTPAVCGLPRDEALAFIHAEEPFERGWYAGPVGWFDLAGNGVFAPALRCAVGREGTWRLFAGAGIVAGSTPDAEWAETGIKFEPVLRALEASRPV
jgi:menaquinone-specific isochorismate synthase